MRILVAEDEESLRVTLAANLELEGYEVVEAKDGKEAIELLEKEPVDLVLSDIRMPNKTGVDLLMHVKRHRPDVPVLLMTAYAMEEHVSIAIKEGVFAVLKKPFAFDGAVRAIVRASEHPCVLIVDDDEADAVTISESLRVSGVRAKAVHSGDAAVAAIHEGGIDVCVTDLVMPEMDGAELVRQIRKLDPAITVIAFSGHSVRDAIHRMSTAGVFACLKKPVDPAELLQTVAKARGGAWTL
jgi:DNA-binding NtrC family response regulator